MRKGTRDMIFFAFWRRLSGERPKLGPKERIIVRSPLHWRISLAGWYEWPLDVLQLVGRGIGTIVMCGIATDHGAESTARFAYGYGHQQIFLELWIVSRSVMPKRICFTNAMI